MNAALDKEELKVALKEIFKEDPDFLKNVLLEIIEEKKMEEVQDDKFSKALKNVFDQYDDTLRRLA